MRLPELGIKGYNCDYMGGIKIGYCNASTIDKAVNRLKQLGRTFDGSKGTHTYRFPPKPAAAGIQCTGINFFDVKEMLSIFGFKGKKLPKSHSYVLFTQGEKSLDIFDNRTNDLVLSATRNFDQNNPWYSVPLVKVLTPVVEVIEFLGKHQKVAPKHTDLAFEVVQRTASSPKEIRVLPSCVANK